MSQWFFRKGTMQIGPVTAQQIRDYARAGQIDPETPLRKASDSDWIKARQIKGLFPNLPAAHATAPDDEDEDAPDPLVALTTQAVTAVGGAISSLFSAPNNPPTANPPHPPVSPPPVSPPKGTAGSLLHALTRDEQSPEVVARVIEKVQEILMTGEELKYIAVPW